MPGLAATATVAQQKKEKEKCHPGERGEQEIESSATLCRNFQLYGAVNGSCLL